jgi:hypothetical protein
MTGFFIGVSIGGASTGPVLPAQTYDGWYLGGGIEVALGDFVPCCTGGRNTGSLITRAAMSRSCVEVVSVVRPGLSIR